MSLRIETFIMGVFGVNVYLVTDEATGTQAIIDTSETDEIVELVKDADLSLILLTHAHVDHAGALTFLQERFPKALTVLPRLELEFFSTLKQQGSWFGAPQFNRPLGRIDRLVDDGDVVEVGATRLKFISTPGHTPGMGCFYDDHDIFVGDTLFAGSIGRTDLPTGDARVMKESLRKLTALPGHLRVYSGHGPPTTIGEELATNPFLGFIRAERGIAGDEGVDW
jgi:glyoxylase-like metal-dependent hydrolase (beta-lactamase superfamily II)